MQNKNERTFINKNKEYWATHSTVTRKSEKVILVEGQLFGAPNYMMRSAMAAKAVQEATGARIIVIVDAEESGEKEIKRLCQSFGITEFINIRNERVPFKIQIGAFFTCFKAFIKNTPDAILELSYKGMEMGHLVYDDILHDDIGSGNKNKHYSIDRLDFFCMKHIYKFCMRLFLYQSILQKYDVLTYVSTHTVYIDYGIMPFLAIDAHIPVVYSDDCAYAIINKYEDLFFHNRLNGHISEIIQSNDEKELIRKAEAEFKRRMNGEGNIDTKLAFSNDKKSYLREDIRRKLGIQNNDSIVFIFAHVFRDSPHISSQMLYYDYYDWLEDTLVCVDKIKGVNWILKEHPTGERIYKEVGVALGILKKRELKNILVCPEDFNTNSIRDVADAIVTCQGTIGMECSCLGIPAVVCGKAFYTGFGFTIEPRSVKEYKKILLRLKKVKKLREDQINKAKVVYAAFQMYFGDHSTLLDNDVLDCIWGYNREPSILEAYKLINERYHEFDFVNTAFYQDVYKFFSEV
ncbi:MAG TPA: hypothetical protein DDY31_00405 [Lachnospiraceae bacterium]|nr:hypothetical protein [Lachnospiraceae bacterium]